MDESAVFFNVDAEEDDIMVVEVKDPEKEKQEWARQMRLIFTPREMLKEDGSLNLE